MSIDPDCYSDLFQPRRKGMRVLVACEYSGIVRNAFLARGHDAHAIPDIHEVLRTARVKFNPPRGWDWNADDAVLAEAAE